MVLEVELCSSGGVCVCARVCVVPGKVKSRSLYLWESLFPPLHKGDKNSPYLIGGAEDSEG